MYVHIVHNTCVPIYYQSMYIYVYMYVCRRANIGGVAKAFPREEDIEKRVAVAL